jgi:hypothetical protein
MVTYSDQYQERQLTVNFVISTSRRDPWNGLLPVTALANLSLQGFLAALGATVIKVK